MITQGLLVLEQPFAAKSAGIKDAAARILTCSAVTHGHMEVVVGGLSSLLSRHDHMGPLAAELAALSHHSCREDALVGTQGLVHSVLHGLLLCCLSTSC